jgi:MFS family permease
MERSNENWLSTDVLLVSLSAFFADLGYQTVIALIPIFLVLQLKEPPYVFGVITAFSYGFGSVFAYVGGRAGDKYGRKKISILGNVFIPLLSFSGITNNAFFAGSLFTTGWWSRNFRTPPRRALLVDVSSKGFLSKTFGFLHALDVAGGMVSVFTAASLLFLKFPIGEIILLSIVPLFASTLILALVRSDSAKRTITNPATSAGDAARSKRVFSALLLSSAFFGLSSYSLGFPVLTVAETQHNYALGAITYGIFLGASALGGYVFGSSKFDAAKTLSLPGYFMAAVATLGLGLTYTFKLGLAEYYLSAAVLGVATGVTETFEPALTSNLVKSTELSGGMGLLSAYRSLGLFISNLFMGLLFTVNQFDSYLYAAAMAVLAAATLLYATKSSKALGNS